MMFDSHCHLQFSRYDDDRDAVIQRCLDRGVVMNTIGTQLDTSTKAVALAEQYDQIVATVGLHPIQSKKVAVTEEETTFVARGEDFDSAAYRSLIESSEKVVAVGETGLDAFHVPKDRPIEEVFDDQWSLFLEHLRLAKEFSLPLVIHVRDAHGEMIRRLQALSDDDRATCRAVVHCFTGNWQEAQAYLDLGFYLGFTGVVTFPPKKTDPTPQEELLEVVDKVPLDRLLVETDAPFLAPQAYRGERCEPWMVEEVAGFIAQRRGLLKEELVDISFQNGVGLFGEKIK